MVFLLQRENKGDHLTAFVPHAFEDSSLFIRDIFLFVIKKHRTLLILSREFIDRLSILHPPV